MKMEMMLVNSLIARGYSSLLLYSLKESLELWHKGEGDCPVPGYVAAVWITRQSKGLEDLDELPTAGQFLHSLDFANWIEPDPIKAKDEQEEIKRG